ncbi:ubiquitin ligase [Histomonas meleagridis]|uniref:ubiquitin ligase n=1 Tax=Histomonas meleagridis TaxID=135588 RepID=UPI003559A8CB|nr:ubiquitin ligase [Histomonas meleagridis]KAH0805440.1 ubiquitin ligase [Histomonas meleagridis]
MDPRTILRCYITQALEGCDGLDCDNVECCSCKNFVNKNSTRKEIFSHATELAKKHGTDPKLCKNLSPLQTNPNLKEIISKFPTHVQFLKKEVDSTMLVNLFKEPEAFSYFLLSNNERFSFTNLALDDNLLKDFYQDLEDNSDMLKDVLEPLNALATKLSQARLHTFYNIRAHILCLFFLSLFPCSDGTEPVYSLVDNIMINFRNHFDYIITQISKLPFVFTRILELVQESLTVYTILNIEDPYVSKVERLSTFIHFLSQHNKQSASTLYSNDILSDSLYDKQWLERELISHIKKSKRFHFLMCYSVLNLSYKSRILSEFQVFTQESYARENLLRMLTTEHRQISQRDLQLHLEVQRNNLIEDTLKQISNFSSEQLLLRLVVEFKGEQGVDVGGVSREFFYLLCNNLFSADYGMFTKTSNGKYWFAKGSETTASPFYFSLFGTIVGLAIYNSIILPIRFPIALYKKLSGETLTIEDYYEIDPTLVTSLLKMKEMIKENIDISDAELTFSITIDNFGAIKEIPLKENGENIYVNNQNFDEYFELYKEYLFDKSIQKQFNNFQKGYKRLCNNNLLSIFKSDELDVLVSGEEIVDWSLLKENTQYSDGYDENSIQIKWFWEIFDEMNDEQKQMFFRFSTGSDRIPVTGLSAFKLVIQKTNDPTKLPISHTCFNIFALPTYESKEIMKEKIMISIQNTEGFGLI